MDQLYSNSLTHILMQRQRTLKDIWFTFVVVGLSNLCMHSTWASRPPTRRASTLSCGWVIYVLAARKTTTTTTRTRTTFQCLSHRCLYVWSIKTQIKICNVCHNKALIFFYIKCSTSTCLALKFYDLLLRIRCPSLFQLRNPNPHPFKAVNLKWPLAKHETPSRYAEVAVA